MVERLRSIVPKVAPKRASLTYGPMHSLLDRPFLYSLVLAFAAFSHCYETENNKLPVMSLLLHLFAGERVYFVLVLPSTKGILPLHFFGLRTRFRTRV